MLYDGCIRGTCQIDGQMAHNFSSGWPQLSFAGGSIQYNARYKSSRINWYKYRIKHYSQQHAKKVSIESYAVINHTYQAKTTCEIQSLTSEGFMSPKQVLSRSSLPAQTKSPLITGGISPFGVTIVRLDFALRAIRPPTHPSRTRYARRVMSKPSQAFAQVRDPVCN